MKLLRFTIYRASLLVFPLLLSGCAGSAFISYPSHLKDTREALRAGNPMQAVKDIQKQVGGQSVQLDQSEVGRVDQVAQQYPNSQKAYQLALNQVQQQQMEAKVRVSSGLYTSASIAVNDNVIPYRLQDYEILMLYSYQALNYFAQGDVQNGLVMIRQANMMQEYVKNEHYKEQVEAQKKADEQRLKFNPKDYPQSFSKTLAAAAGVKNTFENGFLYYLSALAFQSSGDLNNALVSIKSALGAAPDNRYVREQLMSILAQRDGASSGALSQYVRDFGIVAPTLPTQAGELSVVYEQGFVPTMESVTIPLPIITSQGLSQIQTFSFPVYNYKINDVSPLKVQIQANGAYETQVIANIQAMAAKSLSDRYLGIFVRETLRFLAKTIATQAAYNSSNQGINLIGLASQIYSILTDNPDLRSWLTLPNNIQVMQHYLTPGTYSVSVSNAGHQQAISVTIIPGHTVLLWVIQVGETFVVKTITL